MNQFFSSVVLLIVAILVISLLVAFVAFMVTRKSRGYNPETGQVEQERTEVATVSNEFVTLLIHGKIVSGFGWVVVLLCLFGILGGITSDDNSGLLLAGGSFIALIMGLGMVALGQLISCFVSIEKNTRATFEILKQN